MRLGEAVYDTGRQYAADFKKTMTIVFGDFLHKWNYTAVPYLTQRIDSRKLFRDYSLVGAYLIRTGQFNITAVMLAENGTDVL